MLFHFPKNRNINTYGEDINIFSRGMKRVKKSLRNKLASSKNNTKKIYLAVDNSNKEKKNG